MFDSSRDYLRKKAGQLNLGREDDLRRVQAVLDALYPTLTRAVSLDDSVLKITTASASAASELRLRQIELMAKFNAELPVDRQIKKLNIQIKAEN